MLDSVRFVALDWSWFTGFARCVAVCGNCAFVVTSEECRNVVLFVLPALYYELGMTDSIVSERSREFKTARTTALFIAGSGLIQKGLDIALEAASFRPAWRLLVLANANAEPGFMREFSSLANRAG